MDFFSSFFTTIIPPPFHVYKYSMIEWMNEWMNEWMEQGMNEWINELKHEWMDELINDFYEEEEIKYFYKEIVIK